MAFGDKKSSRSSFGGGGYSYDYDDEGRGHSKTLWEEFNLYFAASDYSAEWLLPDDGTAATLSEALSDSAVIRYVENMTWRYNIHDWAFRRFEDTDGYENDGRVRRIVVKKCGLKAWHKLQERAKKIVDKRKEERVKQQELERDEYGIRQAAYKAERIAREEEEKQAIMQQVDLSVGTIMNDFEQAFSYSDIYNRDDGDWLDDPVDAMVTGHGMGAEVQQAHSTKLQITLSLDLSNSMQSNGLTKPAAKAYRNMWLALEKLEAEHNGDLFIGAFEFAIDGWESNERGRVAKCLSSSILYPEQKTNKRSSGSDLGPVEAYRDVYHWHFAGEDTWLYPLFEKLEWWETNFSDPGAHRLDIIITDAVIEHPSDIKRSDKIQERRDGSLQTIFLNFLDEENWVNSDLPSRCVQYGAKPENIDSLLRNIVAQFVQSYV